MLVIKLYAAAAVAAVLLVLVLAAAETDTRVGAHPNTQGWRPDDADGSAAEGRRRSSTSAGWLAEENGGAAEEGRRRDRRSEGGGTGPDEQVPWSAYDRLKLVSVNETSIGRSLSRLFAYQFSVNRPQLQKSLSYLGPHPRLRRLVSSMLAGGEFRVGVVGGSISFGHGASQLGSTDWFALVRAWMPAAFPAARLRFHNGCVPATPAAFMTLCLEHYLDPLADLVFVEYVLNDGIEDRLLHNRRVRIYERLVRRILDQPHAPTVVLVNVGTHGMFHDREFVSEAGTIEWRPFHHTLEDVYGAVAQYYDLTSLSFRNAIYSLGQAANYHFDAYLKGDYIHPNDAGHRIIADMVVHLVQEVALGLTLWPLTFADEAAALGKLPDPMYPGNHPSVRRVCFHAEDFFTTVVRHDHGWEWVNEGTAASPKWGFVSKTPGSVLRVRLDTSLAAVDPGALIHQAPLVSSTSNGGGKGGAGAASKQQHTAVVIFSYLKSWEQMGKAQFRCESGCSCKPRYASGFTELPESTIYLVQLHTTPNRNCSLVVINDSEPGGKDTKFKVTGVMVNMVSDATKDLNENDFAEDWPQYGLAGVRPLPGSQELAGPVAGGGGQHRLKGHGRLAGHEHVHRD